MKKIALLLALSLPVFANTTVFSKYESVRQGFLTNKLVDVNKNAAALAEEARTAGNEPVATLADAVAKAPDMAKARTAFAALSTEMIKQRPAATGAKPAVYHCPMVEKSWLQPKGKIGNPYDAAMVECGMLKEE
jgi:hypothetical protein